MYDLWQVISEIALKLHPDRIETLARQISSLGGIDDLVRIKNIFGPQVSEVTVKRLEMTWRKTPDTLPIEIASALRGASAASSYLEENESIEMVWTGPPTGLVPTRHTEQVLLEVIESANNKLFMVSFVAYNIEIVINALEKAVAKGIRVDILLESSKSYGGKLDIDSIQTFQNCIPSANIYKWKSDAKKSGKVIGAVHAKCAVADSNLAFITSANLTMAAMEQNMELGVLIRGGNLPEKLQRHLESLVITELIEKL